MNLPASHSTHFVDATCFSLYLPALQSSQLPLSSTSAKRPASHSRHLSRLEELKYPIGHLKQSILSFSEYFPISQAKQVVLAPDTGEYLPSTQIIHSKAFSSFDTLPGSHFLHCILPVIEYLPRVQEEQNFCFS